ncbi:site-specific integrase [Achromobacter sp. GG226]|uniref:tyrosine-type recombinase/integrase n=1 Tax=Verticiella alkaliphila TaxID=2779529 RepID=UPI001C0B85EA|nr:site-specific integrase [Verticiella sp. GG226]MBU4610350.1 site-specific integrase [Verticiella sp. GG226]
MASIQKTSKGYRAQVKSLGVRDSQVFATRREAVEWAALRELEIRNKASKPAGNLHTLRDALRKFSQEEAPKRRGTRWEQIRLQAFEHYPLPLDVPFSQVDATHIAVFRDYRIGKVKPGSVLRELTLLSAVFQVAKLEWRWIKDNPCRDIKKPPTVPHRERVIHWHEVRRILRELDYRWAERVSSKKQAVGLCFLLALRTGMRAGELCNLHWSNIHERHVRLPMTKNGKRRDVPLSSRAQRIIVQMQGWHEVSVFNLTAASLDSLFRKYRAQAGLSGFTFHDSRHTAATMLCKKVDVLTLCKVFGWSNTKQALTYYNPSPSAVADMLG